MHVCMHTCVCVHARACVYLYSSVSGLNLYTITLVPQITVSGHRKIFLGQLWTLDCFTFVSNLRMEK